MTQLGLLFENPTIHGLDYSWAGLSRALAAAAAGHADAFATLVRGQRTATSRR